MRRAFCVAFVLGMFCLTTAASAHPSRKQHIGASCPRLELRGIGPRAPIFLEPVPCLLLQPPNDDGELTSLPDIDVPQLRLDPPGYGQLNLRPVFLRPPGMQQRPIDLGLMIATGTKSFFRNDYTQALKLVTAAMLADALGSNVSIEKDWSSLQDVVRLRANVGGIEPFMDIGYVMLDPRLMVAYTPSARPQSLSDTGQPDLLYLSGDKSWYYFGGLALRLSKNVSLRFGGTYIPRDPDFSSVSVTLRFWPDAQY